MIGSVSELVEFAARIDIFVDRRNRAASSSGSDANQTIEMDLAVGSRTGYREEDEDRRRARAASTAIREKEVRGTVGSIPVSSTGFAQVASRLVKNFRAAFFSGGPQRGTDCRRSFPHTGRARGRCRSGSCW